MLLLFFLHINNSIYSRVFLKNFSYLRVNTDPVTYKRRQCFLAINSITLKDSCESVKIDFSLILRRNRSSHN